MATTGRSSTRWGWTAAAFVLAALIVALALVRRIGTPARAVDSSSHDDGHRPNVQV